MLLVFLLHGEDVDEAVHLDPFAVESAHETVVGGEPVLKVVMESGEKWRLCDPERDGVKRLVEARMLCEEVPDDPGAVDGL